MGRPVVFWQIVDESLIIQTLIDSNCSSFSVSALIMLTNLISNGKAH